MSRLWLKMWRTCATLQGVCSTRFGCTGLANCFAYFVPTLNLSTLIDFSFPFNCLRTPKRIHWKMPRIGGVVRALGGDVAWHLKPQNFDFTVFTVFTLARVAKSLGFWAASQLSMKAMAAGYDKKIKGMVILPVDVACLGSFCAFVLDSVLTSWLRIQANLLDYFKHV